MWGLGGRSGLVNERYGLVSTFRETLIKYHKNKAGFSTPQNCPKTGNSAALEMTESELISDFLARIGMAFPILRVWFFQGPEPWPSQVPHPLVPGRPVVPRLLPSWSLLPD